MATTLLNFGVRDGEGRHVAAFLVASDALNYAGRQLDQYGVRYECYIIDSGATFTTVAGAYASEITGRFDLAAEIAESAKPGF